MMQTTQANGFSENIIRSSKDRLSAPQNKRKFSYPISLHASTFLSDVSSVSARRRLSNVSDVVSRKLSSTIGWKSPPIPTHDIILQGKCLCGQYIRSRLKRSGIFNKKVGLQRLRSIIGTPAAHVVRDVFPALNYVCWLIKLCRMIKEIINVHISSKIGEELERMHPKLYTSVTRQISRKAGGELSSPESAQVLLSSVARDLFRNDITWGKVR